jgi:hypothetical protein
MLASLRPSPLSTPQEANIAVGDEFPTAQHHEGDEPSDLTLAVRVPADKLGRIIDRLGFGLDPPALGRHGGAFGFCARRVS